MPKNPSLAVGRGEKLPASKGAGLTAKGRAKYNPEAGRRASFCARMAPIAKASPRGSRARASMRRWKCR